MPKTRLVFDAEKVAERLTSAKKPSVQTERQTRERGKQARPDGFYLGWGEGVYLRPAQGLGQGEQQDLGRAWAARFGPEAPRGAIQRAVGRGAGPQFIPAFWFAERPHETVFVVRTWVEEGVLERVTTQLPDRSRPSTVAHSVEQKSSTARG